MDPSKGGPCQGIRNSIPPLAQLGFENEVVCLDDPQSNFLQLDNFVVHALGAAKGVWAKNSTLEPWLIDRLLSYDAVIIHGLWLYHSYITIKVIKKIRKTPNHEKLPRVFVMPHGMLDPWFQRDRSRRLKAWRNYFYWKLVEHRTIRDADGILFTCQKELELARDPFRPYEPKAEINVGYGVAPPPATTETMRHAFQKLAPQLGNSPYLLFLSRIHPKKGVDLLIDAYASISKRSDTAESIPKLVIAGPIDSDYARDMQQLAASHGLLRDGNESHSGPGIVFPGMLQGDAKWGVLRLRSVCAAESSRKLWYSSG